MLIGNGYCIGHAGETSTASGSHAPLRELFIRRYSDPSLAAPQPMHHLDQCFDVGRRNFRRQSMPQVEDVATTRRLAEHLFYPRLKLRKRPQSKSGSRLPRSPWFDESAALATDRAAANQSRRRPQTACPPAAKSASPPSGK